MPSPGRCTPAQTQLQKKTVDACRSYLELPHFNRDVIFTKSHAAAGLCDWAVNIVKYYDVVSEVRECSMAGGARDRLHMGKRLLKPERLAERAGVSGS